MNDSNANAPPQIFAKTNDMISIFTLHDSFTHVPWRIHMCDMPECLWHDSFKWHDIDIHSTSLKESCHKHSGMSHIWIRHGTCVNESCDANEGDMSLSFASRDSIHVTQMKETCDAGRHIRRDVSFICVTWLTVETCLFHLRHVTQFMWRKWRRHVTQGDMSGETSPSFASHDLRHMSPSFAWHDSQWRHVSFICVTWLASHVSHRHVTSHVSQKHVSHVSHRHVICVTWLTVETCLLHLSHKTCDADESVTSQIWMSPVKKYGWVTSRTWMSHGTPSWPLRSESLRTNISGNSILRDETPVWLKAVA